MTDMPLTGCPTIDDLFDVVEDAIDRAAADLSVTYDSEFNYPRDIRIDFEEGIADDEVQWRAGNLEPTGS